MPIVNDRFDPAYGQYYRRLTPSNSRWNIEALNEQDYRRQLQRYRMFHTSAGIAYARGELQQYFQFYRTAENFINQYRRFFRSPTTLVKHRRQAIHKGILLARRYPHRLI